MLTSCEGICTTRSVLWRERDKPGWYLRWHSDGWCPRPSQIRPGMAEKLLRLGSPLVLLLPEHRLTLEILLKEDEEQKVSNGRQLSCAHRGRRRRGSFPSRMPC